MANNPWCQSALKHAEQLALDALNLRDYLRRIIEQEKPARQYFSPVGTEQERISGVFWPGDWVNSNGHLRHYKYGWHTGADLNLNSPHWDADRHRPVYAIADGEVYAVRTGVSGWGTVICIVHNDCLSRYAHCENILVEQDDHVDAGEQIARIGNAGGRWPYHLHFDIARLDARMAKYSLDWPGQDRSRVERDYLDPLEFLRSQ